jgi:asparagine synthase (glutamine-hydrolysing)
MFRSGGDTEVLLTAIAQWGVEYTVGKLEGMFAFAFHDSQTHQLVLVRDRLGIKPLFVAGRGDCILFSSDVRAFEPWISFQPDLHTTISYLRGGLSTVGQNTFFRDVRSLEPGCMMTCELSTRPKLTRLLSREDFQDGAGRQISGSTFKNTRQAVDQFEQLLLDSVQQQLDCDGQVGVLCSGGVDSSLILAMARRFRSDIHAFHANVVGQKSELQAAQSVANHLGVTLHSTDVHDKNFVVSTPHAIQHLGRPFSHQPHVIPYAAVCRLASESGCKGVLSGEGADELFVGYREVIPKAWRLPLMHLQNWLQVSKRAARTEKPKKDLLGLPERIVQWHDRHCDSLKSVPDLTGNGGSSNRFWPRWSTESLLKRSLPGLLERNDAMGMAVGLEARFPMLNTRILQLAVNLPLSHKLRLSHNCRGTQRMFVCDKWLLRQVARRYLPHRFCFRRKRPFPTDAFNRLQIDRNVLRDSFVTSLLGLTKTETREMLASASPRLILRLMHVDIWGKMFIQNNSAADVSDRTIKATKMAA